MLEDVAVYSLNRYKCTRLFILCSGLYNNGFKFVVVLIITGTNIVMNEDSAA